MTAWMCGTCGEEWERPSARFCSYCGTLRAPEVAARFNLEQGDVRDAFQAAPAAGTALGPFTLELGDLGGLATWAGVHRDGVHGLIAEAEGMRAVRLTLAARQLSLQKVGDPLPRAEDLVCPPLATRKGLFIVERAAVHRMLAGGRAFQRWVPPGGGAILAACASAFGEVWLAVGEKHGLALYSGGGEGSWVKRAFASGMSTPPGQGVGLVVRSEAPGRGQALVWGGGRAIQFDDGAASPSVLFPTDEPIAATVNERIGHRVSQPPLVGEAALLRSRPAVFARLTPGAPRIETIRELDQAESVSMTADGIALGLVGDELIAVDLRGGERLMSSSRLGAGHRIEAMLPLRQQVLTFTRVENAVEIAVFDLTGKDGLRVGQRENFVPAFSAQAVVRALPPLLLDGEVWLGLQAGGRLRLWRLPVI